MTTEVFRGMDHIMVRVETAEPLMRLFADTFGLPVSWPLQRTEVATYGWVTLGNVNLEFWAAASNRDLAPDEKLPLFHGFALDPENLARSLELLEARGIGCKTPRPYVTADDEGRKFTNFTNSVILDVSGAACCIFFCEWGAEGTIFPWTGKRTALERQAREQQDFSACGGGCLGLTGLIEVKMGAPEVDQLIDKWQAITGERTKTFDLGRGVRLAPCEGASLRIESLVLGVRSLAVARSFLLEKGLLGSDGDKEISIGGLACCGLDFRLREA